MSNSGVGGGGARGASPKVLIYRKFGKNLNEFGANGRWQRQCKRTVTTAVQTDGDNGGANGRWQRQCKRTVTTTTARAVFFAFPCFVLLLHQMRPLNYANVHSNLITAMSTVSLNYANVAVTRCWSAAVP